MLTKNTDKLRAEVSAHVAADSIIQGDYWDAETQSGCFIGCLAHGNNPFSNEQEYGLPVMIQRIAENIFEALPADDAKAFFAALPDAVAVDGKDLSLVGWQFLSAELKAMPQQRPEIQEVIDPVIAGMDRLAQGLEWSVEEAAVARQAAEEAAEEAEAAAAAWAAARAAAAARQAAAAWAAARAAAAARQAAEEAAAAAWQAAEEAAAAARQAAEEAAAAAWAAAWAAAAEDAAAWAAAANAEVRQRQRDLLLRLISEAPIVA